MQMKENIQPIKTGRNPSVLLTALDSQKDAILGKQNIFEQELRTYSGDDPLGLWYSYIRWVEQSFPSGGKSGNLWQILQRCLVTLSNMKKYEDDPRLCEIWMKFANTSTEPLVVYHYMYSNNICSGNAQFYTSWAWQLEQIGSISAANEVLIQGLNSKAQPTENIICAVKQFELRFTKLYHSAPNITNLDEEWLPESCLAFNILKPVGSVQYTPAGRNKEFVTEPEKQLLIACAIQPCAVSRNFPFNVYSANGVLPVRSLSQGNINIGSCCGKENVPVAPQSKLRSWKVHQVMPHVVSGEGKLGFTFRQDSNTEECSPSSRKLSQGFSALRLRRNERSPPVALFEKPDPMKKPMYDKMKVYCGGAEEFSFEEIRVAMWFENQRKLKKQELWHRSKHSISKRLDFSQVHRTNFCCTADLMAFDVRNAQDKRFNSRCFVSNQEQIYPVEEGFSSSGRLKTTFEHSSSRDISHSGNLSKLENELPLQTKHKKCPPFVIYCSPEKEINLSKTEILSDYNFCDDGENVPPIGYLPKHIPHQRAGVLQPIQRESEENDCSVEETDLPFMKNNVTINTPVDTVQFVCSAVAASTPIKCNNSSVAAQVHLDNFLNKVVSAEYSKPSKSPVVSGTPFDHEKNRTRTFSGSKISSTHSSKDLSVIFETTREHRSKSTSGTASSGKDSNSASHFKCSETNDSISVFKGTDCEAKSSATDKKRYNVKKCAKSDENKAVDPFDPEIRKHLLSKIKHPIVSWNDFHGLRGSIKDIKSGKELYLRSGHYLVTHSLSKETNVNVYAARFLRSFSEGGCDNPEVAVRVYDNHNYWEFYICTELQRRLLESPVNVTESITKCLCALSYDDGTAIVTDTLGNMTLADLINLFKNYGKLVPECLAMYLAFEVLLIVSQIHQCGILHCNIKLENFVVIKIPSYNEIINNTWAKALCLRLVDFRMGVDVRFFDDDAAFYTAYKDINFPQYGLWRFDIDYYGIASTFHKILFMQEIKVRTTNGHHELVSAVQQHWQRDLWMPLFEMLLNVLPDAEPPNVRPFLDLIVEKLKQQQRDLKFQLLHLSALYEKHSKRQIP